MTVATKGLAPLARHPGQLRRSLVLWQRGLSLRSLILALSGEPPVNALTVSPCAKTDLANVEIDLPLAKRGNTVEYDLCQKLKSYHVVHSGCVHYNCSVKPDPCSMRCLETCTNLNVDQVSDFYQTLGCKFVPVSKPSCLPLGDDSS